jgi:hypothetical protein
MAKKYDFVTVDAGRTPDVIFRDLQEHISNLEIKKIRNTPRINGAIHAGSVNHVKHAGKQ